MIVPDYHGGSIVNLMASLVAALGDQGTGYPTLRLLPPQEIAARNVVLLVIDGLGHDHLLRAPGAEALRARLAGRITSVFPSTTATAITTFLTAQAPQQHGLTGWHMYFRELGAVIAVLPFRARLGGEPLGAAGIDAAALLGHTPVFDRIGARSYVLAPSRILHSDFNASHSGRAHKRGYTTLGEFFGELTAIVRSDGTRKYVYAYWPDLDHLAHEVGIESPAVAAHLAELDGAFDRFLRAIAGSDTLIIVTADHGFVDVRPAQSVELEQHPAMTEALTLPLCGERRVAYCYVHPQRHAQFERYVRSALAPYADLFASEELLARGFFGLGEPHPALLDRIGHYTLIMKDRAVIKDWLFGEHRFHQVGVHGGVSEAEMYVPLIVARA